MTSSKDSDDPSIKHFGSAPQVAWSDLDALVVFYSYTTTELERALEAAGPGKAFSEPVRSWVHEHQHLYYSLTTPFGLFIWRLRSLQTMIARDLLIALPRMGLPVKLPLLRYIESLPPQAQKTLNQGIAIWYAAELFLAKELGSLSGWISLLKSPFAGGLSPDLIFRTLQAHIARQYEAQQQMAKAKGVPIRDSLRILPSALMDEPLMDESDWRALDRTFSALRLLLDEDATLPTVLESAAFAAELWGRDANEVDRLVSRRDLGSGTFPYVEPLASTARVIGTDNVRRLVLTHLALCDLALFPPVLPQHRSLRRNGLVWRELLPELRMEMIFTVLSQIEPMHDPDDYARFTQGVCDRLGWVSPAQIAKSATVLRPAVPDLRESLYEKAMEYRRHAPWLFVWPEVSIAGMRELQQFHALFTFPIMQYNDKVLYHKDKELLAFFENGYLFYIWHRRLMTGRPQKLKIPWRSSPEEVATLREQLRSLMSFSLDRDVLPPDLIIG